MPAGLVQEPGQRLSVADEETIRAALHRIGEHDRWILYGLVAAVDAAAAAGDVAGICRTVEATAYGTPERECLAVLAGRRIAALPAPVAPRRVPAHLDTSLPHRQTLEAVVGSAGQWHDRRTHYQCFDYLQLPASVLRPGWRHLPKPHYRQVPIGLYWRHRRGHPGAPTCLGLSRHVTEESDGTIRAVFELATEPDARLLGKMCADRAVGFSIGTEDGHHEWQAILDPDEWAPTENRYDLATIEDARLAEVSATPTPALEHTGVVSIR